MAQLFGPEANTIGRVVLGGMASVPFIILFAHLVLMNAPYATGQGNMPAQPIPFSHKHHVMEIGLDCRYCHWPVENSADAGVPPTKICMSCHARLWTNAAMLAPVRQSWRSGQPIQWQRVNRLPDYVYFDHAAHVANGVGCTTCHGDIQTMPLTMQAAPLTMGWCLSCHRNPGPFLRSPDEIFSTQWSPDSDPRKMRRLIAAYLIHSGHLTDCSTCHR